MNDLLRDKLKNLRLSGFVKSVDIRNEQAIKENMSFLEFLEILVNDEIVNRTTNGNAKRMYNAKFPQHKTIEEFNFSYQPSINKQSIYNLGTCEFIRKKENIALIGPAGVGKTHLAIAIGVKAVMQGYNVLFTTANDVIEDLYMSRADNSFQQRLKKYIQADLLIIDELGLKKLNQQSVDDFYEVISKRYENNSTIITSNKSFEEWGRILFDPVLASAILDRLVHHCNFIVIDGNAESYRMRERKEIVQSTKKGNYRKANSITKNETEDFINDEDI